MLAFAASVAIACGHDVPGSPTAPVMPTPGATYQKATPIAANRMFGYYGYREVDAGCGWTNWVLVYTTSVEESRQAAASAVRCRQQVTWTPFAGFEKNWDLYKTLIKPFSDAGVLHSVYAWDEPMANGVSYDRLAAIVAMIHAEGWKAMITEQAGGIDKPHPAVDYFGLDWYATPMHMVRRVLQMHPEVNILCAAAYGPNFQNQEEQFALAQEMRVGIIWWMWPSLSGYQGVVDAPEIQALHRQLYARW